VLFFVPLATGEVEPRPDSFAAAIDRAVVVIAGLSTIGGLVGFHALQKDYYGLVGRIGFWMAILGGVSFFIPLEPLHLLGAFIAFIGVVLYGVATLQARVLPLWCGIGFIVGPLLFLALGRFAQIPFGLLWLALGYVLWSRRGTPVGQPSRVR
jgi:hypothetical protein